MEQTELRRISLPYDFEMPQLKPVAEGDVRLDGGYLSQREVSKGCGCSVVPLFMDEFPHYDELSEKCSLSRNLLDERMKAFGVRANEADIAVELDKGGLLFLALNMYGCFTTFARYKEKMTLGQALLYQSRSLDKTISLPAITNNSLGVFHQEKETAIGWWNKLFPDIEINWEQEVTVFPSDQSIVVLPPKSQTGAQELEGLLRVLPKWVQQADTIASKLAVQLHEMGHIGGQYSTDFEITDAQAECFCFFAEFHADLMATKKGGVDRAFYRYLTCHNSPGLSYWLGPVLEAVREGKKIPIYTDIRRAGMEILSRFYVALSDHDGPICEHKVAFQSEAEILHWKKWNPLKINYGWPESFYVLDCLQQGGVFDNSEKPLASHMARQMVKAAELVYGRNCIEAEGKHFLASKSVEKQRQIHALKQNWAGASTL